MGYDANVGNNPYWRFNPTGHGDLGMPVPEWMGDALSHVARLTKRGLGLAPYSSAARALDHPTRRRILETLLREGGMTRPALVRAIGGSPTAVDWHVRQLRRAGLVNVGEKNGRRSYTSAGSLRSPTNANR